ncbi:hypothetical protein L873DRAFT_1747641 [Choiromyces venosus 120613-1]|uniref:AIG1-type G domain-containing protein n=1 Tax=Choiromyces venosus 120613-1 TaxID=1336337 RepID=A0A3N4J715_9PEZI|nr:hypothetical protein L873DRAFT_1747641 [Choiromyces venosus 120613-1]
MAQHPDPRKTKEANASDFKESVVRGISHRETAGNVVVQPVIPIIFVMGVSGAGKSSFIKALGGKDHKGNPPETSSIESVTHEVGVYKTTLGSREMLLIDTPGFEDNKTSNLKTLQKICQYILQVANNPAFIIHGAVYVHNIATSRWTAGDGRTWDILKALCGNAAMGNVIVATTRWPADHEDEDFEMLEKRNLENYWEGILGTVRLSKKDTHNPKTVIGKLLQVQPQVFQAHQELSNGRTLSDTSAGRIAIPEAEQELIKAKKEKEAALAGLVQVSLKAEQLHSQNAPPRPPKTNEWNANNHKREMDALLLRLQSATHANQAQLQKMIERGSQKGIQQAQALRNESEELLKEYYQLRRKIESADNLEESITRSRMRTTFPSISRENMADILTGGAIVVQLGFYIFYFSKSYWVT